MQDKEQVRRILSHIMPIASAKYYRELNHALVALMNDDDVLREAVIRTPQELFALACNCVATVTGVKRIAQRLDKRADVVLSRYYVIYIMLEELHQFAFITYGKVGKMFDKQLNHASIIHARQKLQGYLESDPMVRRDMRDIAQMLTKHGHWRTLEALERIVPLTSKQ